MYALSCNKYVMHFNITHVTQVYHLAKVILNELLQ